MAIKQHFVTCMIVLEYDDSETTRDDVRELAGSQIAEGFGTLHTQVVE